MATPQMIRVKVMKLSHGSTDVTVADGVSVRTAIEASGYSTEGQKVLVDGRPSNFECLVHEGMSIVLSPKVEGGQL